MESLLPFLVATIAIGLMYFMCIRPMRRGQCGMMPRQHANEADTEREDEIARLRAEIAELRGTQKPSRSAGAATNDPAAEDSPPPH